MVVDVSSCKWDGETRTLTTVANEMHEEGLKAFEGAAWFKDKFRYLKKKDLKLSLGLPRRNYSILTALTQLKLFTIAIKYLF